MWLHFLIFFLIIILIFIGNNYQKTDSFICISIFIVFFTFAAFRNITVGNDTQEYYRVFQLVSSQSSLSTALTVSRYESGYIAYNYFVSRFTNQFQWILAINAGIYLSSSIWFIKKYAASFNKAVILFFSFGLYYNVMNIDRQCIAIALFLVAISFLEKKKYLIYALLILLASSFHMMSFVLLVLVVIPRIDFSNSKDILKWSFISIIVLISLNYGIDWLAGYFPYFSHYLSNSVYSEGGIRLASIALCGIRMASVGLLMFVSGGRLKKPEGNESDASDIFYKLLLLDCVITVASIGFNMYDRIEKYVCIGFIVCIVNAMDSLSLETNRKYLYGTVFLLSFGYLTLSLLIRPEWSGIIPYSFAF